MVSILAALLLQPEGLPTASISYRTVAKSVTRVLLDLSELTHVNLRATPQTGSEIVLISVKDVPADALLTRLATACRATWKPAKEGFQFVVNEGQRRRDSNLALHNRATLIRRAMDRDLAKYLLKQKKPDRSSAQYLADVNPAPVALMRVLSTLPSDSLASVHQGQRLVFSSDPTSMQLPLEHLALDVISQWVQDNNRWIALPDPSASPSNQDPSEIEGKIEELVSRAQLVIEPQDDLTFNEELSLYSHSGEVLKSVHIQFSISPDRPDSSEPSTSTQTETRIEYSPETEVALRAMPPSSEQTYPIPAETLKLLHDPEDRDPMSFDVSDQLLSLAKLKKVNMVADVPDSLFSGTGELPQSVEQYRDSLASGQDVQMLSEDGWLTVRPIDPQKSSARVDRHALRTLIQETEQSGVVSLDSLSNYALRSPNAVPDMLEEFEMALFVPGANVAMLAPACGLDMLRLYGTLSSGQRQQLLEKGTLSFSVLSSQQIALLSRIIYSYPKLSIGPNSAQTPADKVGLDNEELDESGNDRRGLGFEPSFSLPNGLDPDSFIELQTSTETVVLPEVKPGWILASHSSVMSYRRFVAMKNEIAHDKDSANPDFYPNLNRLRIGKRTHLNFTFHLTGSLTQREHLTSTTTDGKWLTFERLPLHFKNQVSELEKEMKRRFEDQDSGKIIPPR